MARAFAELEANGLTNAAGEPRRLLGEFRQLRQAQLAFERDLGMTPAARMTLRGDSRARSLDIIADLAAGANTEDVPRTAGQAVLPAGHRRPKAGTISPPAPAIPETLFAPRHPIVTPQEERLMVSRWRRDPVAFVREVLMDPESGQPFVLYPAQERFLRAALTVGASGHLPYTELVYACPKKSGKTATAAMAVLYVVVVLGGRYAEGYCVANDLEQAQGRVFAAIVRMVEASPLLRDAAKVSGSKLEFLSTGATITALASDYASAAGANPTITVFDELWAYTSERSRRLWDEMVPVPTRRISVRLTTTYAGFEGESELLEDLYKRGMKGRRIAPSLYRQRGLLMFWSHRPVAPWQTKAWLAQMRGQLRPNAFLRMIENRFVTSESTFVEPEWWALCEDAALHPQIRTSKGVFAPIALYLAHRASVTTESRAGRARRQRGARCLARLAAAARRAPQPATT